VVDDIGYQSHHRDDLEGEGDDLQFHPFSSCAGRDHPAPSAHIDVAPLGATMQEKNAPNGAFILRRRWRHFGALLSVI
jgi:hypothetical protein